MKTHVYVKSFSKYEIPKNERSYIKTAYILLVVAFVSCLLFYGRITPVSKFLLRKQNFELTTATHFENIPEQHFRKSEFSNLTSSAAVPEHEENAMSLDEKFENYFENEKILAFKKEYISKCYRGRAVLGGILHGNSFNVGFGAMMNTVFNAYVIADETDRSFQFIHFRYAYTHPNQFFTDFASNSSCTVFPVVRDRAMAKLRENSKNFSVNFDETKNVVNFSGPNFTALMFATPQVTQVFETVNQLRKRDGNALIDARKSNFLRAIWNPQPKLKILIKKLWTNLMTNSNSYFGVHLRRGDKISTYEMNFIPLKIYAENLIKWCKFLREKCPKTVFITSDDPEALRELGKKLKKQFIVKDLSDLIEETIGGMNLAEYIVPLRGKSPFGLRSMTNEKWIRHTREVIVTITLLAMSDYVLCTLSSNLCRFVAQFRADRDIDSLHSLDW